MYSTTASLSRLPGQEEEVGQGEEQTQYDGRLSLTICPELSLAEQNYACAECQALLQVYKCQALLQVQ